MSNIRSYDDILRKFLSTYGANAQIDMALEEMSELSKALLKYRRAKRFGKTDLTQELDGIVDEIADVKIMVRQMELLFGCEKEVEKRIEYKIARQEERLAKEALRKEDHLALKREMEDLTGKFQEDETEKSHCDGCDSCKDGRSCCHDEEPEEYPQVAELCPYCENEVYLNWDVEEDGYQVFCPYCGNAIMLCSMCDARDGAPCDWKEGAGCKHSRPGYVRKENPWIPISDHRPDEGVPFLVKQDFRFGPVTIGRMRKSQYGNYIWECLIVSEGRSLLLETLAIAGKFSWPDMDRQEGPMMYLGDKYIQGWMPIQKED